MNGIPEQGLRGKIAHLLRAPRFWAPVAVASVIFASSQVPGEAIPEQPFYGFDKVVHACFYTALCLCLCAAPGVRRWKERPFAMAFLAALSTALFGALDELHQSFVPDRSPSFDDWAVDASMGLLFSCVALLAALRARRSSRG